MHANPFHHTANQIIVRARYAHFDGWGFVKNMLIMHVAVSEDLMVYKVCFFLFFSLILFCVLTVKLARALCEILIFVSNVDFPTSAPARTLVGSFFASPCVEGCFSNAYRFASGI